jgi:N-6 DNA methylase
MSGTNGQFRTPRHIISMIVTLVNPQPGMRICDSACGTAGFLIAAYNHILQNHTSKAALAKGHATGDLLKPAQWKFLEDQAFTGYDNDANMVKIGIRGKSIVFIPLPPLCALFSPFSAFVSFVFNRLQPLFRKHPGVGVCVRNPG